jgi:aminoglycoside/choline kinase family phosphotransferase
MVQRPEEELLAACFQQVTGTRPTSIAPLRPHASERRIYRLTAGGTNLVGVVNQSQAENDAFVALARHFKAVGLPVPTIHAYQAKNGLYLEDDLGDVTLLDFLTSERAKTGELFPQAAREMYRKVLSYLPRFQIEAATKLDFSVCLAPERFFSHTLPHDLASFSSELLARLIPTFEASSLATDFQALIACLEKAKGDYFLYRDFQSRNIMLVKGEPVFIDFQSGLKGPLQYDVVSLLYQSSAKIPDAYREALVEDYLMAASRYTQCDREQFFHYYPAFIVSRMLQVLGVYGRQGLGAKKDYFARSIPEALKTLRHHLVSPKMPIKLNGLLACSEALLKSLKEEALA